jgi:transposase InsO family protein
VRFAFIEAEKANYPVDLMCSVLEVSRSGYYAWVKREPCSRVLADRELSKKIGTIYEVSQGRYGSPRIHKELEASNTLVSLKRVARLMKEEGLCASPKRRFVRTTDSKHDFPIAPNYLECDFTAPAPDKIGRAHV